MLTFSRSAYIRWLKTIPVVVLIAALAAIVMPRFQAVRRPFRNEPGTLTRVAKRSFEKVPLYFIENRGQLDPHVKYYVQGHDVDLFFTPGGVTYVLTSPDEPRPRRVSWPGIGPEHHRSRRWTLKLEFVGAAAVEPVGEQDTAARVSYFKGRREAWNSGLPTYGQIVYRNLWPGIDLVYHGTGSRLKYDFVVHPGADPNQIRLAYRGSDKIEINEAGQLEVKIPGGGIREEPPYAYQKRLDESEVAVEVRYELLGGTECGFRIGAYDHSRTLVLDPVVLVYAGYLGGSGRDSARGIAVDADGNVYVTGWTTSADFPVSAGPDLTYNGGTDVYVAKVNVAGTALVYTGFIGGAGDEQSYGLALDAGGNAYVTGWTTSTEATFPVVVGPGLRYNGGMYDAFVAKLNAAGTDLIYAGYIGGTGSDFGSGIAVDGDGNAYVGGWTTSNSGFPVKVGPSLRFAGNSDAFVAKVNADGTDFVYSGFIGGPAEDVCEGIAIDGGGNAYITGHTYSNERGFPVKVGPSLRYGGGDGDAFVAKVSADGTSLVYAGYIGGAGEDEAEHIAVDASGNAYITGSTSSNERTFPVTVGPGLRYNGGAYDAFVAKVNADGTALVYAGYIGGAGGEDGGLSIALDGSGNAYVIGATDSTEATFPVTVGPGLKYNGGSTDAFVAKVNADGTSLVYAGYIGGSGFDYGFGIALDAAGNVYVCGRTESSEATFPVTVGPGLTLSGSADGFIAKITEIAESTAAGRMRLPQHSPSAKFKTEAAKRVETHPLPVCPVPETRTPECRQNLPPLAAYSTCSWRRQAMWN